MVRSLDFECVGMFLEFWVGEWNMKYDKLLKDLLLDRKLVVGKWERSYRLFKEIGLGERGGFI